jgi:hypothetical protein
MTELADISVYINPVTVAICMILGKMIKSSSIMKKIPNDTIPFILMTLSIIISCIMVGFNGDAVCSGIFSAAAAVGIHQQGKQGFKQRDAVSIVDDLDLLKDDETKTDDDIKG